MAAALLLSGFPALSTPPLKGDRLLDGTRDFPWLNLAQVWSANPSVYNTTSSLQSQVDHFLGGSAECATNGVAISREPTPPELANTRAADVRVLRMTSASGGSANKTRVLINLGIHGREYITGEVSLHLLAQLCDGSQRSRDLLDETEFIIIPLLNVAGREKVESDSASCSSMRKNENDVDLNRNFDFVWNEGSDDTTQEDYRGDSAMSEPESKLLNHTASTFKPLMFIDVHSGDQSLMYPFSFKAEECPNAQEHQDLLDHVNDHAFCHAGLPFNDPTQKTFKNTCGVRAGPAALALSPPYTASGTTLDFMYEVLKIPFAYTWEVYSGTRYMAMMAKARNSASASASASAASASASASLAHHTQLLATGPSEAATRYDAVLPHRGAEVTARKLSAAAHAGPAGVLMPGGARPAPAAMPDMSQSDCFAYFNPTSANEMAKVAATWAEALVAGSEFLNARQRGRSMAGAASAAVKASAAKSAVL